MKEIDSIFLQGLGAGLFVCDAAKRDFLIVKISPSFTVVTGYTGEEAVNEKLSLLYGSKTEAATVKAINRALRNARPFRGELLCHRSNATAVWCELIAVPMPVANGLSASFAMGLIDISERKKREEDLRAQEANSRRIFENAIEGIYQSTPQGRYLNVNVALARMYGYRSTDALLKQVSDIGNQIYVDFSMREKFKNLMSEADCVRGLEYQVRRRDGRVIWISENARVVRDGNGSIRYYEGFIEEITLRKEAEAALQQSQQQLIETSRQIGLAEMANGILHNVGNALNSVNVSASIAADRVVNSKVGGLSKAMALLDNHEADLANFLTSNPKGQQWVTYLRQLAQHLIQERTDLQEELKSLKKSAEHANEIIAFQQDYAKTLRRVETVNAIDLVEDALRMNVNSLARHHIEVVREYSPNLPRVTVQKHGVLQILVNLIQNAKKACEGSDLPDRRLILSVTFSPEEDRIRIDVHDSGAGIPSENLARIFTHGFTTRKNGHGFGLHSGARIAKELGGSLTAHSEGVGKGSTFTLEFPSQSVTKKPANVRCVPL